MKQTPDTPEQSAANSIASIADALAAQAWAAAKDGDVAQVQALLSTMKGLLTAATEAMCTLQNAIAICEECLAAHRVQCERDTMERKFAMAM